MTYQIGNIVSLKKGDTKSKWLVVAHTQDTETIKVVHEDELNCASMPVYTSMIRIARVSDADHKQILTKWIKTREGKALAEHLTN
jgi:hypothetical protein